MTEKDSARAFDVILETVRYAELEREDLEDDESGLMIRSVWQLLDPCGNGTRDKAVSRLVPQDDASFLRFTAHSHDNEPLAESYDDILVYHTMRADGVSAVNYIIDRFCPKKIK